MGAPGQVHTLRNAGMRICIQYIFACYGYNEERQALPES